MDDLISDLLSGLNHYHVNGIMHRDIKPANVLMQIVECPDDPTKKRRGVYKITDHGHVTFTNRPVEGLLAEGLLGTPWYCAPEILGGKPYNEKVDIYSLGVMVVCLLTRHSLDRSWFPKESHDIQAWMFIIDQLIGRKCDLEHQLLARGMLMQNPQKRWSAAKCIQYRKLDPSQKRGRAFAINPTTPWTTTPFLSTKRKLDRLGLGDSEQDVERDDAKSEDGETIKAPSDLLQVGSELGVQQVGADNPAALCSADLDLSTITALEASEEASREVRPDNGLATPKLSCAAQMPATPCQGGLSADAKDDLPSVPCTPVIDNETTMLQGHHRPSYEPEVFEYGPCDWDWNREWDPFYEHFFPRNRFGALLPRTNPLPTSKRVRLTQGDPFQNYAQGHQLPVQEQQFVLLQDTDTATSQNPNLEDDSTEIGRHISSNGPPPECILPPSTGKSAKDSSSSSACVLGGTQGGHAPPEASPCEGCLDDNDEKSNLQVPRFSIIRTGMTQTPSGASFADTEAPTEIDVTDVQTSVLGGSFDQVGYQESSGHGNSPSGFAVVRGANQNARDNMLESLGISTQREGGLNWGTGEIH